MAEQMIGRVTHYFGKAKVAAIAITEGELRVGDTVHILGHTSDFTQEIGSMQVEHQSVEVATTGDHVGVQVAEPTRENDQVFLIVPD
jgi:putative protease